MTSEFGTPTAWRPGMPVLWVLVAWTQAASLKRSRCPVNPESMREIGYDPAECDDLRQYLADLLEATGHDDCTVLSAAADDNQEPTP